PVLWQRTDVEIGERFLADRIVLTDYILEVCAFLCQEFADFWLIVQQVEAHGNRGQALFAIFAGQRDRMRKALDARATPGGPVVDEDDLAFVFGDQPVEDLAVAAGDGQPG